MVSSSRELYRRLVMSSDWDDCIMIWTPVRSIGELFTTGTSMMAAATLDGLITCLDQFFIFHSIPCYQDHPSPRHCAHFDRVPIIKA